MTSREWSLLTNHGHTLLALYRDPSLRQREIAELVGITEGAVHRILADLSASGHLTVERVGRRNRYQVNLSAPSSHGLESGSGIGEVLACLSPSALVGASSPSHHVEHAHQQAPVR